MILLIFIRQPGVDLRVLDLLVARLADHHVAGQTAPERHSVVEVSSAHHRRLLPCEARDGCVYCARQMQRVLVILQY